MWVKVEGKRRSEGQKFVVRCASKAAGEPAMEERPALGAAAARKTAEMLGASLNVTATVYGADDRGEFVYGVYEPSDSAAEASSPIIKRLFAESAAASLSLKDRLIADMPEDSIRGFASLAASVGYLASQHKQAKRSSAPRVGYATLFRIFLRRRRAGDLEPSGERGDARAAQPPALRIAGLAMAERARRPRRRRATGDQSARQARKSHAGHRRRTARAAAAHHVPRIAPGSGRHFMLILQGSRRSEQPHGVVLDSIALVYHEVDETEVVALTRRLLQEADPFKNRVVLVNRDVWTVRSRISDRSWKDIVPNERAKEELDFIAASIRDRETLKAEGLTIKRGLLLSGPPGDGKSTAIECFANDIAGEATIIVVEAVERIRAIYHLAQTLAPAVVILEDLDLMTRSRQTPSPLTVKDDVTGELLQVLSGTSAYPDVVTIATTNYFEAIDVALSRRAGRFDAHVRMGYPTDDEKLRVLELYFDRFSIADRLTRRRLQMVLAREFGQLQLVPAHIEEFVKAGVKRAQIARRPPEYLDFEPGIEAIKSIAVPKPTPQAGAGAALAEALAMLQKLDQEERPTAARPNWPDIARPALSHLT